MVRSRLGLKALGLCALVLGLMAFVASAAQAELNAHWNVINAKGELIKIELGATLLPQLEIKEIEKKTALLLFEKSGIPLAILCTSANFDEGGLLIAHGGISLGRILFKGCVTLIEGKISAPCKPKGGGAPLGEILTEKGKGLIVLDKLASGEIDEFVKITPENAKGETSKLFVKIELGEECAIGTFVNVEAKSLGEGLWITDCGTEPNKSFLEEKEIHLIEESKTLRGLIALGKEAIIDGSALVGLGGAHVGLSWGGTPA